MSTDGDRSLIDVRTPLMVNEIPEESLNLNSGLQAKDVFVSINGQQAKYRDELNPILEQNKGKTVDATILRDGRNVDLQLVVNEDAAFGIILGGTYNDFEKLGYFEIVTKEYGFFESFGVGANKKQITGYWAQLKKIFTPSTGAYKGVGGFKAIFDIFPDTWVWQNFWSITAFLSIMLGVLNLLPIPALDGGHVMFLLYEMITGRKPGDKFMEYAQMIGFFLLIALILLANGNDIYRAIFK